MRRYLSFLLAFIFVLGMFGAATAGNATAAGSSVQGDVDGNGIVSSGDAAVILRSLAGLAEIAPSRYIYADVNLDGIVTSADAALILRHLAGLTALPTRPPATRELFAITDLQADGDAAYAQVTAGDACYLNLRILEDMSGQTEPAWTEGALLASNRTEIAGALDAELVELSLSATLPDYYTIVAVLENEGGDALCEPYVCLDYTAAYETFAAKTIYDFPGETVLNLDAEPDSNFMVLLGGVALIESGANTENILDDTRADEGIFVIDNADAAMRALATGERVVLRSADELHIYLVEVSQVVTEESRVTLTAKADYAMEDFLSYIKIDTVEDIETATIDMTDADGDAEFLDDPDDPRFAIGVVYDEPSGEGEEFLPNRQTSSLVDVDKDISQGINYGFTKGTANANLTGKLTGTLRASVKIEYDLKLFGADYFYAKVGVTLDAVATLDLVLKHNATEDLTNSRIALGSVVFPVGTTGLTVSANLAIPLDWNLRASGTAVATLKTENGFVYSSTGGYQPISTKDFNTSLKVDGSARITVGPELTLSAAFLTDVVRADIGVWAGVEIFGTAAYDSTSQSTAPVKHACALCVDGYIDKFANVNFRLSYKLTSFLSGTPVNVTLAKYRAKLFDYYISLINESASVHQGKITFGKGACPNKSYRTSFEPKNASGSIVSTAAVIVKKGTTQVAAGQGAFAAYLYPGSYVASATGGGLVFDNKSFTVGSNAQAVVVQGRAPDAPTPTPGPTSTPAPPVPESCLAEGEVLTGVMGGLTIRTNANLSASIVDYLLEGQTFYVYGAKRGTDDPNIIWYKIKADRAQFSTTPVEGYISSLATYTRLTFVYMGYGEISGTNVNFRSGPGTNHPTLPAPNNQLQKGRGVLIHEAVIGTDGQIWYLLEPADSSGSGILGYVRFDYVDVFIAP
ncbi:MAG: dockerin type I domain-containing protein [Clostridiales bacterium]|nr:dockerin type I domain-containing protein [Clostridiales bacterium]